tara:strand:+ start:5819 stop:5980 length:162 start_codon:yes stop_codon:yes gene_type:complete
MHKAKDGRLDWTPRSDGSIHWVGNSKIYRQGGTVATWMLRDKKKATKVAFFLS